MSRDIESCLLINIIILGKKHVASSPLSGKKEVGNVAIERQSKKKKERNMILHVFTSFEGPFLDKVLHSHTNSNER